MHFNVNGLAGFVDNVVKAVTTGVQITSFTRHCLIKELMMKLTELDISEEWAVNDTEFEGVIGLRISLPVKFSTAKLIFFLEN
jgi:hypothetical protein